MLCFKTLVCLGWFCLLLLGVGVSTRLFCLKCVTSGLFGIKPLGLDREGCILEDVLRLVALDNKLTQIKEPLRPWR